MKVFVTGVCGQLGYDCVLELISRGHEAIGSGIQKEYSALGDINVPYISLDITDAKSVLRVVKDINPDVIIHCAAWTNVDGAEAEENKSGVYAVNSKGTENLSNAAKSINAKMVYISTDYVFDGRGERPWKPDDKCYAPLNVYGQSKLEGEKAVSSILKKYFIVRVSWLFGLNGRNFITARLDAAKTHDTIRVVNDQIGTPTYTVDLSRLLVDMIETDKYGYYHATNEGGYISWYDFCCEIYRQCGIKTKVIPIKTGDYGLAVASRPYNSRLDKSKLVQEGFTPLPAWQDAVSRYLSCLLH